MRRKLLRELFVSVVQLTDFFLSNRIQIFFVMFMILLAPLLLRSPFLLGYNELLFPRGEYVNPSVNQRKNKERNL